MYQHIGRDIPAPRAPTRGFTIVELLIVIVVIGILASITVAAYSGVQVRAKNAKTLAAVDVYKKALSMHIIDHGAPPDYSQLPANGVCFGSGYPDVNADGVGDCIVSADKKTVVMSALAASDDPLMTYIGKQLDLGGPLVQRNFKPAPHNQYFTLGGIRVRPGYGASTIDGNQVGWWIVHIIQGKGQSCRSPIVRAPGDTTSGIFFSATVSEDLDEPWRECYEAFM